MNHPLQPSHIQTRHAAAELTQVKVTTFQRSSQRRGASTADMSLEDIVTSERQAFARYARTFACSVTRSDLLQAVAAVLETFRESTADADRIPERVIASKSPEDEEWAKTG